ncbi:MAG TPA: hypothetical protein VF884_05210 [Nitrososphaeraceae archaeon]
MHSYIDPGADNVDNGLSNDIMVIVTGLLELFNLYTICGSEQIRTGNSGAS